MNIPVAQHRSFLNHLASEAMRERGFEPEFSPTALAAVEAMTKTRPEASGDIRDARSLPWCSIDNDDSRDLDQLTVAESLDNGSTRILVAVADVSGTVANGSELDRHARVNTTSVYTPPRVFSMLPERLSTDLTSLNPGEDRFAFVVEAEVTADGGIGSSAVYRAVVHNQAKLAYPSVGAWLENKAPIPPAISVVPDLAENLRIQDRVAQSTEAFRHEQGALEFATIEIKALIQNESVHSLKLESRSRASELIENFMIIANGVIARFLTDHGFPVLRRVVKCPERWDRIIDVAAYLGTDLPAEPDAKALQAFLTQRRSADPLRFPDLSLTIIKLLGRGDYVACYPDQSIEGHFGLAVSEYTHSTAPNRRYPDLITQRLVRAALAGQPCPVDRKELTLLAEHCTQKEDDAKRIERHLVKSAAALLLGDRLGETFDGIITGASHKGTWVRIFDPPVEGRVERGAAGLDVGDKVNVKLIRTNPERGFIDFERISHEPIGRRRQRR